MRILCLAAAILSGSAFAGGQIGGGSGGYPVTLEIADAAFNLQSLPKTYLDSEEFRRTHARLSVGQAAAVPVLIDGEQVQVKKLAGSIVDLDISKEILSQE